MKLTNYMRDAFVRRLDQIPDSVILDSDGYYRRAWEVYARRMLQHTILVETMRSFGLPT